MIEQIIAGRNRAKHLLHGTTGGLRIRRPFDRARVVHCQIGRSAFVLRLSTLQRGQGIPVGSESLREGAKHHVLPSRGIGSHRTDPPS